MSRGKKLQEMEVKTQQSKSAVNAGAKAADPMPTMADPGTQLGNVEDLGGPTPENYKPDDDSAKLKTPGGTLKQVKDVVTKGAKPAEAAKGMAKEEEELSQEDTIEEDQEIVDEIVDEEVEETVEEYDVDEDVNALLGGEELSEEFKEKAKVIFEAAINAKVATIKEELEEKYVAALEEQLAEEKEALAERVDSYLEYVADEWFAENALVVEHGLKTEMTESFLEGMKGLFEEHYVSIPDEKYDVLESMVEKLDEMEEKLNEQIEKNISLNGRLSEATADGILDKVSEGLATTQKEKLASLSESVEFESEEQYREKLEMLKESYFSAQKTSTSTKTETLSEGVDSSPEFVSGSMDAYLKTLSSFGK
jgi:AcrR family transcriptional regulator|tara:strand:- start:256 stop:1353 length:1098 start_codon:yes stop_codon:yes gene_type:complete